MRIARLRPLLVTLSLLAPACGASDSENVGKAAEGIYVADDALARATKVLPDTLVVPLAGHEDLLDLPYGKVLVGSPAPGSASNPRGYLRKVSAVAHDSESIIIHTIPAALTDALDTADIAQSLTVSSDVSTAAGGLKPQGEGSGGGVIDFSGITLLSAKESAFGMSVSESVTVDEGFVSFHPSVQADLTIRHAAVEHFILAASGDLEARLVLGVDVHADQVGSHFHKKLSPVFMKSPVAKLPPIDLPVQWIGIVPVYETVELSVELGCTFLFSGNIKTQTGIDIRAHVAAGGEYVDGAWRSLGSAPSLDVDGIFNGEVDGPLQVVCSVEPVATVLFYDLLGPFLGFGPYLDTQAALDTAGKTTFAVYPGFSAEVGGDLQIFGKSIGFATYKFFDWESATPILSSN